MVLARAVAARYLSEVARPEYRLTIFLSGAEGRNIPSLLSGMRDGRLRLAGMSAPPDFGVREEFDSVAVWSSEDKTLRKLAAWFEARGFETSGVH
ncbi:MAG: hypothetical protein EBT79_11905 [Actinobacteria bacterium]|nr:hypothetical protein [Actinomycetota bacterium]NBR67949.1 hypothetical protein [Actinomycetota bacterium]